MFGYFDDLDRNFRLMNELRRRLDSAFLDFESAETAPARGALRDAGDALLFEADLPGASLEDVKVTLAGDVLTIAAERKVQVPSGYSVHRRERQAERLVRSWVLPVKVDADKTEATLVDGVLSVRLAKAPEVAPRQIAVRAD